MALNWYWGPDYVGQVKIKGEIPGRENDVVTYNCYTGNALIIVLWETEHQYVMHWFAGDEQHLKNMLEDEYLVSTFRKCEFTLRACDKTFKLFKHLKGIAKFTFLRDDEFTDGALPRHYNVSRNEEDR